MTLETFWLSDRPLTLRIRSLETSFNRNQIAKSYFIEIAEEMLEGATDEQKQAAIRDVQRLQIKLRMVKGAMHA